MTNPLEGVQWQPIGQPSGQPQDPLADAAWQPVNETDYGDIAKSAAVGGARGLIQAPGAVVDLGALLGGELGKRVIPGDFGKWLEEKSKNVLAGNGPNWLPSSNKIGNWLNEAGVDYAPRTSAGQTAYNVGALAAPAVAATVAAPFTGGASLEELPMLAARYGTAAALGSAGANAAGAVADKVAPTDPYLHGLAEFAGGAGAGSFGARALTPMRPGVLSDMGIKPVLPSDISNATQGAKFGSWLASKVPGSGGIIRNARNQQVASVGDYARDTLGGSGPMDNYASGYNASQIGASIEQRLDAARKAEWNAYDTMVPSSTSAAPMAQPAASLISNIQSQIGDSAKPGVVSDMQRFGKTLSNPNITAGQLKILRGDVFDAMPEAGSYRPFYAQVADAVTTALGDVAKQRDATTGATDGGAFDQWQKAMQASRTLSAVRGGVLGQINNPNSAAPLTSRLLGNPALLDELHGLATPDEYGSMARGLTLSRANNGGDFDIGTLMRGWSKLPQATKDALMRDDAVRQVMTNLGNFQTQTKTDLAARPVLPTHDARSVGIGAFVGEHLADPLALLNPHTLAMAGGGLAAYGAAKGLGALATKFPEIPTRLGQGNPAGAGIGAVAGDQGSFPAFWQPPQPPPSASPPNRAQMKEWLLDPNNRQQAVAHVGQKLGPQVAKEVTTAAADPTAWKAALVQLSSNPAYRKALGFDEAEQQ